MMTVAELNFPPLLLTISLFLVDTDQSLGLTVLMYLEWKNAAVQIGMQNLG